MIIDNEDSEYENRLKTRLDILQSALKNNKIVIANHLADDFRESFEKIKYDDNGQIILSSVDGRIRSMALAIEHFDTRDKLKEQISLNEIQKLYFDLIEQNFSDFYIGMLKADSNPNHIAEFLSTKADFVDDVYEQIPTFINALVSFWKEIGEIGYWHLEDNYSNITGVFGGDLFPTHDENIASKCGIYTDKIVLPDPYIRSMHIFKYFPKEKAVFYFLKHAMNILKYKELACIEKGEPIVVILPDLSNLEENGRDFIASFSIGDALTHGGKIFGRKFETIEEFSEFCVSLNTVEKTVNAIKDKKRVLFDTNWEGNLEQQISRALQGVEFKSLNRTEPGLLLQMQAVGRMGISNELLIKSRQLSGTPIIDAETSWMFLNWKLEYDAEKAQEYYNSENLHIIKV